MNCVVIIGRLTRDPELRYTPGGGKAVARFTTAVNRPYKNKSGKYDADFINVQVWGKMAENSANYLEKGQQVGIQGRIQTRSYEDKEGVQKYVTEIVAEKVEFLSKPNGSKGINGSQPEETNGYEPVDNFDDDDIPF